MEQKINSNLNLKRILIGSYVCLSILLSNNLLAQPNKALRPFLSNDAAFNNDPEIKAENQFPSDIETDKTRLPEPKRGFGLESLGGLSFTFKNNPCHWFKFSGVLRLDQTFFVSSTKNEHNFTPATFPNGTPSVFPNSGIIRALETYLDGGVGKDWTYTLGLSFGQSPNTASNATHLFFQDTWVSYIGLFTESNEIFIGRVPGNWFGSDNSNSTSWNPFLERSLIANAFYPGDGLGVMTDFWWKDGCITLVASAADHLNRIFFNGVPISNDRWRGVARLTYAPLHEKCHVVHFGVSAAYLRTDAWVNGLTHSEVAFRSPPSARGRNTARLVDTGAIPQVNYVRLFDVESAYQYGPFMLEGEWTEAFAHRVGIIQGPLRFYGWNLQSRYLITGEYHEYDVRDGNFGTITPCNAFGAFEVALRYDYLNLNSKDILGGTQHDVTVGLNWFISKSLRASVNYIHARIHPTNRAVFPNTRNLDIIAARLQVRFK